MARKTKTQEVKELLSSLKGQSIRLTEKVSKFGGKPFVFDIFLIMDKPKKTEDIIKAIEEQMSEKAVGGFIVEDYLVEIGPWANFVITTL